MIPPEERKRIAKAAVAAREQKRQQRNHDAGDTLERETDRQDCVVITGMEVRRGDLVSPANREADSSPQAKASHD